MTRAERIEEAARALLAGYENGGLLRPEWDALRAALAQPATGGDEYRRGVEDAARVCDVLAGLCRVSLMYPDQYENAAKRIRALSPTPDAGRCERCGGSGRNLAHEDGDGWLCPACGGSGSAEGGR